MGKTVEQIKNEMEANSKAWHTADSETRKTLEATNQELGKQIGGVYDAAAGKWSDSNGNPLFGNSNTNTNGGVDINGAINDTEKLIDKQIENLNNYESTMTKLYQDRTDFEVKKIEQQKEEAKKDLEKEQTAAYVDYQKQINPYGANAEQLASQGMGGTGYAESSRVKMYSAYQNRVAIAKESYNKAVVSYNNAMTEARLQNSTVLAQLAFDTLTKSLELSLQGLQYRNELLMKQDEINYNRKRDALADERYEEEKTYSRGQDALANEIQYATLTGDYSKLEAKGWVFDYDKLNQSYNDAEQEKLWKLATTAAQYGNFELLEKYFNIKVSDEYKEAFKNDLLNNGGYYFDDTVPEPEITNPIDLNTVVSTEFYNSTVNPDAQYGVFENTKDTNGFAYQPNNIDGNLLTPSGDTYTFDTIILYGKDRGKVVPKTQTVWELKDGSKWVWDGILNRYKEFPPGRQIHDGQMMVDIDITQAPHAVL